MKYPKYFKSKVYYIKQLNQGMCVSIATEDLEISYTMFSTFKNIQLTECAKEEVEQAFNETIKELKKLFPIDATDMNLTDSQLENMASK